MSDNACCLNECTRKSQWLIKSYLCYLSFGGELFPRGYLIGTRSRQTRSGVTRGFRQEVNGETPPWWALGVPLSALDGVLQHAGSALCLRALFILFVWFCSLSFRLFNLFSLPPTFSLALFSPYHLSLSLSSSFYPSTLSIRPLSHSLTFSPLLPLSICAFLSWLLHIHLPEYQLSFTINFPVNKYLDYRWVTDADVKTYFSRCCRTASTASSTCVVDYSCRSPLIKRVSTSWFVYIFFIFVLAGYQKLQAQVAVASAYSLDTCVCVCVYVSQFVVFSFPYCRSSSVLNFFMLSFIELKI